MQGTRLKMTSKDSFGRGGGGRGRGLCESEIEGWQGCGHKRQDLKMPCSTRKKKLKAPWKDLTFIRSGSGKPNRRKWGQEKKRGKLFYIQLELYCWQLSFFAYSLLSCLLEALSHCKQKISIASEKAPTVSKKLPNTIASKKLHCKQEASNCKLHPVKCWGDCGIL